MKSLPEHPLLGRRKHSIEESVDIVPFSLGLRQTLLYTLSVDNIEIFQETRLVANVNADVEGVWKRAGRHCASMLYVAW